MAMESRTFSESWHRVANLRVNLRHAVTIRRQLFGGTVWHVLHDPFNNQFFRLSQAAYAFAIRLRQERTVAEVWDECLARTPDDAPGQDEVIQLLAQLYHANLLYCNLPPDSGRLFERYHEHRQRQTRSKLLNLMFFKLPLFDPEHLLRRAAPLVRLVTGRLALAVWLGTILLALKSVIEHHALIVNESRNLLLVDNLALLYVGLVLVKTLHEFGHTLVCKRFNGEVHTMGVMLIIFAPLPFMDATSSWAFRDRWQRILVAASGMLFEFFAAACAALLWANTGPGTVHNLAFNMMVVASLSTVMFNLNPLLRYDGYFILSDLLDVPNLQTRSLAQLRYLMVSCVFGDNRSANPAESTKEAFWLTAYGIASGIYRVILYGGIILFVADRYLLVGMLMAAACLVNWGVLPTARFIAFLAASPQLTRNRSRAILVSLGGGGLFLLALGVIPFPDRVLAPGVLEAKRHLRVASKVPGQVTEILAANDARVQPGTPLLRLANPELVFEIAAVEAQRSEVLNQIRQSFILQGDSARAVLEKRLMTLNSRRQQLATQQEDLLVTALQSGVWVAPESHALIGVWLPRGAELGTIVGTDVFRFSAVVSQEEAASLFAEGDAERMEIRLTGQGTVTLPVTAFDIIPFQQQRLPSAALGWRSGGDIPVSGDDDQGLQTIEPYFRLYADVASVPAAVLNHGHSGKIRIKLPPKPLLSQLIRKFLQFFQKRYQL